MPIELHPWISLVLRCIPSVFFSGGWSEYGQGNASSLVPRVLVHLHSWRLCRPGLLIVATGLGRTPCDPTRTGAWEAGEEPLTGISQVKKQFLTPSQLLEMSPALYPTPCPAPTSGGQWQPLKLLTDIKKQGPLGCCDSSHLHRSFFE